MPWTRTGGAEVTGRTVGEKGSESVPSTAVGEFRNDGERTSKVPPNSCCRLRRPHVGRGLEFSNRPTQVGAGKNLTSFWPLRRTADRLMLAGVAAAIAQHAAHSPKQAK